MTAEYAQTNRSAVPIQLPHGLEATSVTETE